MLTRGREAQARASPDTVLSPLPRGFVRAVFLLLPVDARLRCCEVSRAWRALLADASLFTSLTLSVCSGLSRFSWPLLRAAVAMAGGQLRALDVTGQRLGVLTDLELEMLEIVVANAATLTDLRVNTEGWWSVDDLRLLLEVAPALLLLEISVEFDDDLQLVRAMLRNEPPFEALRLRRLYMHTSLDVAADVITFGSDLRCHASLEMLFFEQRCSTRLLRWARWWRRASLSVCADWVSSVAALLPRCCRCLPASLLRVR